ncbi:MAG: T9SS type A sorting domain-containing protein, partial [Flavobacteriia bacterium]
ILAYPNPTQEALTLSFPLSLNETDLIFIYDINGQVKMKLTPETGTTKLYLGTQNDEWFGLPKGIYFVSARVKGQLLSKKLIKF